MEIKLGIEAPDFELIDTLGKLHRLSEFRNKKIVLLAMIRGFA